MHGCRNWRYSATEKRCEGVVAVSVLDVNIVRDGQSSEIAVLSIVLLAGALWTLGAVGDLFAADRTLAGACRLFF